MLRRCGEGEVHHRGPHCLEDEADVVNGPAEHLGLGELCEVIVDCRGVESVAVAGRHPACPARPLVCRGLATIGHHEHGDPSDIVIHLTGGGGGGTINRGCNFIVLVFNIEVFQIKFSDKVFFLRRGRVQFTE